MSKVTEEYGVKQITKLEGLDPIRRRPGMYIGSTSQLGIDQLLYEVIDNSIDEFIAGWGKEINILVNKDCSVKVIDYGRGIPVGKSEIFRDKNGNQIDTLTGVLTNIHAGGKFGKGGYKCFTSDSEILTNNGLKPISKIAPLKDKVYNANNELSKVDNKFEYDYNGDINCITTEDGKTLKAIDGHYVLVSNNNHFMWKKIEDITIDDYLVELEEHDNIEELKKIIPIYNVKKYKK